MLKRLRRVLFWTHLTCGVVAGLVILMMCITGVSLTYQRQIQLWADTRHYRAAPPDDRRRAPAAVLVSAARGLDDSAEPTALTLRADPFAPAAIAFGTRTVFANPYTAEVYGEGTGAGVRAFFTTMVSWHRYVAQAGERRPAGKAMTGAANLAFLAIVLSGMCLWWPKSLRWTAVRQVVWFRGGLPGKARDFNWHNTLGFWSALPLALIVYSGVVISYPAATNMIYRAFGETPPAPGAGRAGAAPSVAGRAALARGGRGAAPRPMAAGLTTPDGEADPRVALRVLIEDGFLTRTREGSYRRAFSRRPALRSRSSGSAA
jgi:uncharacterized iron-regulated membrane protein